MTGLGKVWVRRLIDELAACGVGLTVGYLRISSCCPHKPASIWTALLDVEPSEGRTLSPDKALEMPCTKQSVLCSTHHVVSWLMDNDNAHWDEGTDHSFIMTDSVGSGQGEALVLSTYLQCPGSVIQTVLTSILPLLVSPSFDRSLLDGGRLLKVNLL